MTSQKLIAVVILAAGESRRMGQPKALLPFPETFSPPAVHENQEWPAKSAAGEANAGTFLCHLIDATRHPNVGVLRVVAGAHAAEIRSRTQLDPDELVVNEDWQRGQLSSLQAAIRSLPANETKGMLVCLVDHPLVSAQLVATLIEAFLRGKSKIVIPTFRGRRGHPVIFPAALYAELLAAPENVGARAVVHAHAPDVMEIPVEEEGVVMNLNDPESLKRITNRKMGG